MNEKIYFSKVEFREDIGYRLHSILLINLVEGTLAYQVYDDKKVTNRPAIVGYKHTELFGQSFEYEVRTPAIWMRNYKTDFKQVLLEDCIGEKEVVYSYNYKFSDSELAEVLSYSNALEFEAYRNREMSMKDEGFCGYRDEIQLHFTGITDSYIPILKLPMQYFYDEEHIWPSEKLYRYILKTYLSGKHVRKWVTSYYGFSLIF